MELRTHIAIGSISGLFVVSIYGYTDGIGLFLLILWTCLFSIFPNIDKYFFKKERSVYTHSVIVFMLPVAIVILSFMDNGSLGRFSSYISIRGSVFSALGLLSHLVADSLTVGGIPLLFPVNHKRHFRFPYIGPRLRLENAYTNLKIQKISLFIFSIALIFGFIDYFI